MKNWKHLLVVILCICTTVSTFCPLAAAAEETEGQYITYYANGFYSVTSITCDEQQSSISTHATGKEVSATKRKDYYDSSNELLWTLYVHGTFIYDGRSVKATSAGYSYDIYNSDWSFECGSASYSGATATATGTFSWYHVSSSTTVSLTCSANGTLS